MPIKRRAVVRIAAVASLVFLCCVGMSAGIRGPGRYSGVVFFDRWDTCVLISGLYVMYISDELKPGFRAYAGQAVEVDATDVFQPWNPGDGLIRKINWVGLAPEPHRFIKLDGLELHASGNPDGRSVEIEIRNSGTTTATVSTDEIGINMFGSRNKGLFNDFDLASTAVITRSHLMRKSGLWQQNDGERTIHAAFQAGRDIPQTVTLPPEGSFSVVVTFDLSPGDYQFVFGYGGGVHEEASLLSNAVSIVVRPAAH